MIRIITISKLQDHLDQLIKQAQRRGERCVIAKRKGVVAAVVGVADLEQLHLMEGRPPLRVVSLEVAANQADGLVQQAVSRAAWIVVEDGGAPVAGFVSLEDLKRLLGCARQAPGAHANRGQSRLEVLVAQDVAARIELR